MNVHRTTGRWRLGLGLSLITSCLWGILPIALKSLLDYMDAYTITWYRYLIAAFLLFIYVQRKKGLPSFKQMKPRVQYLLITAAFGLIGNYILYLLGLDYISPSSATVVIQLAPIFLLFGSLILFKEHFSFVQWAGFAILIAGLLLFFNDRLYDLFEKIDDYTFGVLLIMASAIFWALYAMAQKQLLKTFPSEAIMLLIYTAGTLFFFPLAKPASLFQLDMTGLFLLVFCAFNTLIAYGSFAEALDHWEASRVSMVLAVIPLITIAGMKLSAHLFPGNIIPEDLNMVSIAGACMVVAGSIFCSLGQASAIKKEDGPSRLPQN